MLVRTKILDESQEDGGGERDVKEGGRSKRKRGKRRRGGRLTSYNSVFSFEWGIHNLVDQILGRHLP